MSGRELIRKGAKLAALLRDPLYRQGLQLGVAAGIEHERLLARHSCSTLVDIGANRGQFALVARRAWPEARIYSFEPLEEPCRRFRKLFAGDAKVGLFPAGIAPKRERRTIHISRKEDSSSLLPIGAQAEFFPGTEEAGRVDVEVGPLGEWLSAKEIESPAFLKIDVQGFEGEVLRGCEGLLECFACVYVEASFVELYGGQALAGEVVSFLQESGWRLEGVYNLAYAPDGRAIQGDFFFVRWSR
ncbi:FkbM family methyltransferase [Methylacidimicrobium tartarophylax]|uniref:2-O-methyltransferase NoeI n=1 Tax=Methylacidimicrobium tartarophylax TaxID=1041768 RepID=A0A5E6M5R2_9BACT|nr:FkbM family methyltransferase [Methylacidimicrobium tartarophylax]VVM04679.1 2-O-methyltransferase NoeI [Methylacidimicrobium tartarophylax]